MLFRASIVLCLALLPVVFPVAGCTSGREDPGAEALAARAIDPEAGALLVRMREAIDRGEFGAALALADSAERHAPELADVAFLRGLVYTKLNRFDEARAAYERTLALDPHYRGAWFKLGNNAFLQGQYGEAIELYRREQELMARSPKAVKAFYAELDQEALPTVVLQMGRAYEKLGRADSARLAYRASLAADSLGATAYAWLAELDEDEGLLEEALANARQAVRLAPSNLEYQYKLGSLLFRTGRLEEALPPLRRVVRQQGSHEGANYSLGQVLLRLGRREEARPFLERAEALQELAADIAEAQAAAYQRPEAPHRWIELAGLLLKAGRYPEAMEALGVAHYLNPEDLAVHNDLANLSLALGDTLAALQRFRRIVAQHPAFSDGWFNLGVVHAMSGDYGAARKAWETALRHEPGHAEAKAYLARLDALP